MTCETCGLVARRDQGVAPDWDCMVRTPAFDVVHAFNTSLLGWTILVLRRHVASIAELNEVEAAELGVLQHQVSRAIQSVTGCSKTYLMQFAEAPGHQHVHFHIVPRMPELPSEHRGANIFFYLGKEGTDRVDEASMNRFAAELRRELHIENGGS